MKCTTRYMISECVPAIENRQITLMSLSRSLNRDVLTFRSQSSRTRIFLANIFPESIRGNLAEIEYYAFHCAVNCGRGSIEERLENAARRNEINENEPSAQQDEEETKGNEREKKVRALLPFIRDRTTEEEP